MKKVLSLMICAIMVISVFAGCGQQAEPQTEAGGEVTISVNNWPLDTQKEKLETFNGYLAKFNEAYPEITLEKSTDGYNVENFFINAASGQLTNLYYVPYTEIGKIVDAGYAKDITKWIKEYGYDTGINPEILEKLEFDGKYYGIPFSSYNQGLMVNMNLFKQAGLVNEDGSPKIPDTYEELTEMAVKIKETTGKSGFFISTKGTEGGWQFMNLAWSYGVDFMEQDENGKWKATFDSDEAAAAMQLLKDWKWKYDILPANNLVTRDDMKKMFAADEVAMAYYTADMVEQPILNYGMSIEEIGGGTIPAGPAGRYSQMGGGLWLVSPETTDEQVDAIFKWLEVKGDTPKFTDDVMQSVESNLKSKVESGLPIVPAAIPLWTSEERSKGENDLYAKYKNYDDKLWPLINAPEDLIIREEEPMYAQELYAALSSVMQTMLTDENADPKAELTKACAAFQKDYLDKID